uniref:Putative 6.7 kDa protein n=1 Tax=Human adenovirus B serotype 7 TaxID=10519 RepID=Q8VBK6_ADE07|nr:putative 6.7 kDa protein [Human adenovirus 7]
MILFQSNTTNTINVQTTLNHDMENHTTSYANHHTNCNWNSYTICYSLFSILPSNTQCS